MDRQDKITLDICLHGQKQDDETPTIAAYLLDGAGKVERKIGVAEGKKISFVFDCETGLNRTIAFGPNVEDINTLRKSGLLQYKLRDQLPIWKKNKLIEILRPYWIDWIISHICVSGQIRKCYPIFLEENLHWDAHAILPHIPFPLPPRFCKPICNGVVEIYENDCCCKPWLLIDIADLLKQLRQYVAGPVHVGPGDPVEKLSPVRVNQGVIREFNPQPDPSGDVCSRAELRSRKAAEAMPQPQMLEEDRIRLLGDIRSLETLAKPNAIEYIEARPYLWPIWCTCSAHKVGETIIGPDGSFQFCYRKFPLLRLGCSTTYVYKVKQWQNNQWVYIYDGITRNQYYFADQIPDLITYTGRACDQDNDGYSNDQPFVVLQDIGSTRSYFLNSHYQGQTAGSDLTQIDENAVAAPPVNGGLANPSSSNGEKLLVNRPWGADLWFRLHFDEGMKILGAMYYRMSVIKAQANGHTVSGSPTILTNPISWQKYVHVGSHVEIQGVGLGPNPVGSETGLYKIPYNSDAEWLDGQYHQYWDTTAKDSLNNPLFDGLFLVSVEVFDASGNRLNPATNGFDFLRLMSASGSTSTAKVKFAKLQHLFWIDNRPVYADIEDFRMNNRMPSTAECQFLSGSPSSKFSAGYRAFHVTQNSITPPETFLWYCRIWYHRGLNGPDVTIESGGTNKPSTLLSGIAAESTPQLFSDMLGTDVVGAKCTFTLNLWVYAKHTNGSRRLSEYDRSDQAAFALENA